MKHKNVFNKMIKNNVYQIFIFSCPIIFPINFLFNHSWFVCVKNGVISRWEIRFGKNRPNLISAKHLYKNSSPPFSVATKSYFSFIKIFWPVNLLKYIEGGQGSLAQKMYYFIENSDKNYKHKNRYGFIGPNCNTYIQWVLNQFPEINLKLTKRFIGKSYIP